jgi:cell division protein DivIC
MKRPFLRRDSIIIKSLRNKYLIAVTVFLVWLLIFDNNSLIDRVKYLHTLHGMEEEKQYYLERIEEDSRRLNELKTDRDNLEKFAREQYFMKKENEDVFVIVEEE